MPFRGIPLISRKRKTPHTETTPLSYFEAFMHLLRGNVGTGMLAMGDAMKNAGLIAGPILTIFLGIVSVHCQHILLKTAMTLKERNNINSIDYATAVEVSFKVGSPTLAKMAKSMRLLLNLSVCITQLGFCCIYIVFIADNVVQVAKDHGFTCEVHIVIIFVTIPILLVCLIKNLKFLVPLSLIANILIIMGTVIMYYNLLSGNITSVSERRLISDPERWPLFFGTAVFAFVGIGLVVPLQSSMKVPKNFDKSLGVLNVGMTIVICWNTSIGFLGYLKFGENTLGSLTLNMPQDQWLYQTVQLMISVALIPSYALQYYVAHDILWPATYRKFEYCRKNPKKKEIVFTSIVVLVTFIFAEAIPFLSLFMSLVGSVSCAVMSMIFPAVIEIVTKAAYQKLTIFVMVKNIFIIILSIAGMITGSVISIRDIVKQF